MGVASCLGPWIILLSIQTAALATCPKPSTIGGRQVFEFEDGSIGMRSVLNVNPDGAFASYTVGDHGFTYVANGMSLWNGGSERDCKSVSAGCREKFVEAEKKGFGSGTVEFCVFAMVVDPLDVGATIDCGKGRRLIGNGKGRLKTGSPLPTVTGASVVPYFSTTALMHKVEGAHVYIDSAQVPSLVSLTSRTKDRGRVAWVRSTQHSSDAFAAIGDLGPAFGEGSIALHQMLRYGILKPQKPGPIPLAQRCQVSELSLNEPYVSKPDDPNDTCKPGREPKGDTDIRAYGELTSVDSILLGKVAFKVTGNKIDEELTTESIAAKATSAGYTADKLKEMAACIR